MIEDDKLVFSKNNNSDQNLAKSKKLKNHQNLAKSKKSKNHLKLSKKIILDKSKILINLIMATNASVIRYLIAKARVTFTCLR